MTIDIGKTKYAKDLNGEGAKLNGGRWHHIGVACIYTAESRALSLLEYSAHVSTDTIPRALSFTTYDVSNDSLMELKFRELPGTWNTWPHPLECRNFGSNLLKENNFLILKFPSAIIPQEYIYVINPLHSKMGAITVADVQDYAYDLRVKG